MGSCRLGCPVRPGCCPQVPSTAQVQRGITPRSGDRVGDAPWGNLAFLSEDFSFSAGLIRLSRIEQGIDFLAQPGRMASISRRKAVEGWRLG